MLPHPLPSPLPPYAGLCERRCAQRGILHARSCMCTLCGALPVGFWIALKDPFRGAATPFARARLLRVGCLDGVFDGFYVWPLQPL